MNLHSYILLVTQSPINHNRRDKQSAGKNVTSGWAQLDCWERKGRDNTGEGADLQTSRPPPGMTARGQGRRDDDGRRGNLLD